MDGNITPELCEMLCRLTRREWEAVISAYHDGEPDPEYEQARERHMSRRPHTSPEVLLERVERHAAHDGPTRRLAYQGLSISVRNEDLETLARRLGERFDQLSRSRLQEARG